MIIRFTLIGTIAAAAFTSGCASLPNKSAESDADVFIHTVLASDQRQAYRPPTWTSAGSAGPSAFEQFVARFFVVSTEDSFKGAPANVDGYRLASDDFIRLLLQ
jgi:hypothetical protein